MTLARAMADMARGAEAVRVTVRRNGKVESTGLDVEANGVWVSLLAESVRVEAGGARAGAMLTFAGGERVTIGAPAPAPASSERDEIRAVREILSYPGEDGIGCTVESMARHVMDRWKRAEERALAAERRASELEALRERAPAASDGAPAARWWQTVGAWGTREGRDTAGVVMAAPEGAWMRYPNGARQWMTAATLDGMTPIPAPPPVEPIERAAPEPGHAPSAEERARMAENAAAFRDGSWKYDLTRCPSDVLPLLAALAAAEHERDHYHGLLEASTRTANDLPLVGRLRAALASLEAERDSLQDALASLESTFRHWADSERNGAREAFKDPCLKDKEIRLRVGADAWTKAADEVARVRKAAP